MSSKSLDARSIGIIGKPHGVKGEMMVRLLTDYPKSIKKGDMLFLDEKSTKGVKIENIIVKKVKGYNKVVFKFEGIDNRNSAENLRGMFLYRGIENAPKLKTGEFWADDIIGCKVYSKSNDLLGVVMDVIKYTSNDNLVIKKENNSINIKGIKENIFLVPLIKNYIKKVDLKNKKIMLKKNPEYI